jgi:hypothetical protein
VLTPGTLAQVEQRRSALVGEVEQDWVEDTLSAQAGSRLRRSTKSSIPASAEARAPFQSWSRRDRLSDPTA